MCTHYGTLVLEVKNMVNTISIRELRPRLAGVLKSIHDRFDRYIITKRGQPEAVMMSIKDYESILETMEIQSDKALMRRIKKAEKELCAGKGIPLEKVKKELGLV
jgi:antitoxin YefM